jgi:hypothetical protein
MAKDMSSIATSRLAVVSKFDGLVGAASFGSPAFAVDPDIVVWFDTLPTATQPGGHRLTEMEDCP